MSSRFTFPGNKNYVWLKKFALLEQTNGKGSVRYVKLCQQHNEMYHSSMTADDKLKKYLVNNHALV